MQGGKKQKLQLETVSRHLETFKMSSDLKSSLGTDGHLIHTPWLSRWLLSVKLYSALSARSCMEKFEM